MRCVNATRMQLSSTLRQEPEITRLRYLLSKVEEHCRKRWKY